MEIHILNCSTGCAVLRLAKTILTVVMSFGFLAIWPAFAAVSTLTVGCDAAIGPAQAGVPYSDTCDVGGGSPPYSWSVSLPPGLSYNAVATITVPTIPPTITPIAIQITGALATAGPYSYTVKVVDSTLPNAQTATQTFTGTAAAATTIPASDVITYFGGGGQDFGYHVAVDAAGNIFLSGSTLSLDLPQTGGGVAMGPPTPKTCFLSAGFSYDCTEAVSFIAKLNPSGSARLYSAYFGGPSNITGMTVDAAGNLYLTGTASGANFPTTKGAY